MSIRGVSVSPMGFLALLSTPTLKSRENADDASMDENKQKSVEDFITLGIRISNDRNDESSSSSPEALTFIQLISGVDMAGAILPPQLLQHLASLHCASTAAGDDQEARKEIEKSIVAVLPDGTSYVDATAWHRGQMRYPNVVLNSVELRLPVFEEGERFVHRLRQWDLLSSPSLQGSELRTPLPVQFSLECKVNGYPLTVPLFSEQIPPSTEDASKAVTRNQPRDIAPSSSFLDKATYSYTPASAAFIALSLALRYKTPIVIQTPTLRLLQETLPPCTFLDAALKRSLPQWKSVASLVDQSNDVMRNVQTGFQANKWQGALRIALQKGDVEAVRKIRDKLKEFDSFDDLPVVTGMAEDVGTRIEGGEQIGQGDFDKESWA